MVLNPIDHEATSGALQTGKERAVRKPRPRQGAAVIMKFLSLGTNGS